MNFDLREQIIKHILANLVIIPANFISTLKSKSLKSSEYLLDKKLRFNIDDQIVERKLWGCQISSEQQELKILLGDCSQENIPEYCLIVQLKDAPAYGLYLVHNGFSNDPIDSEAMLACSLNGKDWLECNTYLQATFLAGMEQVKEIGLAWSKCTSYDEQYEMMLSFLNFHAMTYGVKDEGQEERL